MQPAAQRPRRKKRRGDAPPAPFCGLPPPGAKGRWGCFVAVFTRRARDITASYTNPSGRAALCPALASYKTPLCYKPPQMPAQPTRPAKRTGENRVATARQCPLPSGALAVNSPAKPDRMGSGSGVFCRCRGLWLRRSMPGQIREANLMPRSDKTANRARVLTCPAATALAACEPQAPGDGVLSRGAPW